ncbi:MAG: SHOCT-like domain-containing protein [Anaerolineae bacterium]
MTTSQEQTQILTMVENGTITAVEGASLLEASETKPVHSNRITTSQSRWLKVRVTDLATGRSKTSVTIPLSLVDIGLRMGAKFAPEMAEIDMDELLSAIKNGVGGTLVDVEDIDKGERVEIHIE